MASIPVGSMATAILVVNNVRDVDTDRKAGKYTIPVRFGRTVGVLEYIGLLSVSYAVPLTLVVAGRARVWALLPLVTLPIAARLCRRIGRDSGGALNASLVATARLLFVHSALFAAGLALG
jgi:1,4-dihydroxy-2-naphthoate octaprenyltransferase